MHAITQLKVVAFDALGEASRVRELPYPNHLVDTKMAAARKKTLSVLRELLRYARTAHGGLAIGLQTPEFAGSLVNTKSAASAAITASSPDGWRSVIMAHFRAGATLRGRAEVSAARSAASDVLAYVRAEQEAATLRAAHRGMDVDAPEQRRSVARFIGFDMPQAAAGPAAEGAAVAAQAARAGDKYRASIAARAASGSTKLSGVDALKAQLYGVAGVAKPQPVP